MKFPETLYESADYELIEWMLVGELPYETYEGKKAVYIRKYKAETAIIAADETSGFLYFSDKQQALKQCLWKLGNLRDHLLRQIEPEEENEHETSQV